MSGLRGERLTSVNLGKIKDRSEKLVARACYRNGCEVQREIQVGRSKIDFLIKNPHSNNGGTLVEVTNLTPDQIITSSRKQRQIAAMKASGYRYVVMSRENLANIRSANKKNGKKD